MIIYGRNAVREAIRGPRTVKQIWAIDKLASEYQAVGIKVNSVSGAQSLGDLCKSSDHQGVCAEVSEYGYCSAVELLNVDSPFLLVLDQIQDPQNFGAICRSAECAGITGVVTTDRRAAQVTPAVCKASAGAVEHLKVAQITNVADFLNSAKKKGCWCYGAAAEGSVSYSSVDYSGNGVVIVLGSEGKGLRQRVASCCDELISLPIEGKIESLNVSAAASVLLYRALQDRS